MDPDRARRLPDRRPGPARAADLSEKQFAANRARINFPFLNNLLAPYLATANPVDLALERDRLHTAFGFGSLRGFSWGLDYKHEDRDGNRPYGASFGFSNATELPEVIDYSIDDTELAGAWNTDRAGSASAIAYPRSRTTSARCTGTTRSV